MSQTDRRSRTFSGHDRFVAPPAAELVSIVADVSIANGAQTIAAQPVFPAKLTVTFTDANSSVTAGTVTVVGLGARGQALSEVFSLASAGTTTFTTADAYATVTSITVASLAGAAGADHIKVGVSAALGLAAPPGAYGFAVHKETISTQAADTETGVITVTSANETVGTVDATAGTIIPSTAPNGARTYDVWYTYSLAAS